MTDIFRKVDGEFFFHLPLLCCSHKGGDLIWTSSDDDLHASLTSPLCFFPPPSLTPRPGRLPPPAACAIMAAKGGGTVLMLKCKCGCFFTLKDDALTRARIRCPNCDERADTSFHWDLSEFSRELDRSGFTIRSIPDDAKITVTFEA